MIKETKEEKTRFYKTMLALVLPMSLQNLISVGVQTADVVMLGRVGETAISSSSLAGQVNFIMILLFFGLTSGVAVLTAQYWGKGDKKTIERILGMAILLTIALSSVFEVLGICIPDMLMRIFSNEEEVIKNGAVYMRIVAVSYIPAAFTMVYLNTMRSVEKVVISTVVYSISFVVNVLLNWVLIFGKLGAPQLGIRGAAIATATARFTELAIVILYATKFNKLIKIRPKYIFRFDKLLFQDFLKYALPVTVNELLWGSGISAVNAIMGHLGSDMVAANSVTGVVRQLATIVCFGISNATAIMLGKEIGEGRLELAKMHAKRFVLLTNLLGAVGAVIILGISPLVPKLMNLGAEATWYLERMLWILAYLMVPTALNTTLVVGVFRAGGDAKVGLYLDVGALWLFAIPIGYICAFVLKIPNMWVYVLLTADELVKTPFSIMRYKSCKWLKNITRDFDD